MLKHVFDKFARDRDCICACSTAECASGVSSFQRRCAPALHHIAHCLPRPPTFHSRARGGKSQEENRRRANERTSERASERTKQPTNKPSKQAPTSERSRVRTKNARQPTWKGSGAEKEFPASERERANGRARARSNERGPAIVRLW